MAVTCYGVNKMRNINKKTIRNFIRNNSEYFATCQKDEIKEKIANYWSGNKKSKLPHYGFIASSWVENHVIPSLSSRYSGDIKKVHDDLKNYVDNVPILKLKGYKVDDFSSKIEVVTSITRTHESKSEQDSISISAIIEENVKIIEEGVKKKTEKLLKREEEKQKFYLEASGLEDSLKDIKIEFQNNENEDDRTWWEKIDLKQNPFNDSGLDIFPKDAYDDILIETPGIKFAKSFKSNGGKFQIGTNYLLAGSWGTGKTCIMEYIKDFSHDKRLYPLYVPVYAARNPIDMLKNFYKALYRKLKKVSNYVGDRDEEGCITMMLDILENMDGYGGFILLIDDLHKAVNIGDENLAIEFISKLQPFNQELKNENIKSSMVFTGLPKWKKLFMNAPQVTSVLSPSNIVELPAVTQKQAVSAITRRFSYFSNNAEQDFKIDSTYVANIVTFTDIDHHTGFRLYFDSVKEKLEKGEYDLFTMNPLKFDRKTMEISLEIKNLHVDLSEKLNKMFKTRIGLTNFPKTKELKTKINILSAFINKKSIHKNEPILSPDLNKVILKHICRYGLVVFSQPNNSWQIIKPLDDLDQELKQKNIPLSIALSNWYLDRSEDTIRDESLTNYKKQIFPNLIEWKRAIKVMNRSQERFCKRNN